LLSRWSTFLKRRRRALENRHAYSLGSNRQSFCA
jgi:hypothetical protein